MANENSKSGQLKGTLALLVCAAVWGSSFVAQSVGMQHIGPFTFQCVRSVLAFVFLGVFMLVQLALKKRESININRFMLTGGLVCGVILSVACWLQNQALATLPASKGGFITAFYLILVPIYGIFLKKKAPLKIWFCAALALVGMYFLSVADTGFGGVGKGDIYCILCAFFYAAHILAVDYFITEMDGVLLSFLQFGVSAILSYAPMFLVDHPSKHLIITAGPSLLYSGLMSCGIGYTLQLVGQKHVEPTIASILMSLESVFSLIAGMVILHEVPTINCRIGCAVMFIAVIYSEIPSYLLWDNFILGSMNKLAGKLPPQLIEAQYRNNKEAWKKVQKKACSKEGYIEKQITLTDLSYGRCGNLGKKLLFSGAELTAADNTCEVIAVYNTLQSFGAVEPGETDFPTLIRSFSNYGICYSGKFGTSPKAVFRYLNEQGYKVHALKGRETTKSAVDRMESECAAFILTAYNKGHNPFSMVHTMSITKNNKGKFCLHNTGSEMVSHDTLYEALADYGENGAVLVLYGVE